MPTLAFLRRRKKLTQHELAAASGVSQGTIARIESGDRKGERVRFSTQRKLAAALGVDPDVVDEFRLPDDAE
jgi:transcriptional regulator with XRE-family HTH domain